MSNISKDHPSIRLHAPPGGHSNNIFGTDEFEQSAANKKKHTESDIFGNKKETNEPAVNTTTKAAAAAASTGNNIFGRDPPAETSNRSGTIAGQYKQTQMKSSIFGTDEPTNNTRSISDKNRSNIFGPSDADEQNKRQTGGRQGLRDPNASRSGYNPINGEAYSTNSKEKENPVETSETKSKEEEQQNPNQGQKNVHTSVRVFHPPGGRSNGPLW